MCTYLTIKVLIIKCFERFKILILLPDSHGKYYINFSFLTIGSIILCFETKYVTHWLCFVEKHKVYVLFFVCYRH